MKLVLLVGAVLVGPAQWSTAATGDGWQHYSGDSHGVTVSLAVSPASENRSTLTFRFGPDGGAVWRRALRAPKLEAFCTWQGPRLNESGSNILDIRLGATRREQTFVADVSGGGHAYVCGLHARTRTSAPPASWSRYERSALVVERLAPVR